MTLIQTRKIRKLYGGATVLEDLDMDVNEGARIGLVGTNGAGKSTLLKILAGIEVPDDGEVSTRRGLTVAYLPQRTNGDGRNALETIRAARPDLQSLEDEMKLATSRLGSQEAVSDMSRMQRVLETQDDLLRRFREAGGPGFEGDSRGTLRSLGIEDTDFRRPTSELSGGQRKLVTLAACLMQKPDVLLLDEPETHLDSHRREQLERVMKTFPGAIVTVSHDRYLLDETVTGIAELDNGKITLWPGNYSAYTVARDLHNQRQQQLYTTQRKEIARLEEAIRRFQDWAERTEDKRHAKQARNKQNQVERMDKIERPVLERRRIGLELRSANRGGQKVVELRDVTVAFDEEPVLVDLDLAVMRGERIGVVGGNGVGKSMLAKLISGVLNAVDGEVWTGPSIEVGYLAQDHSPLSDSTTPIDLVRNAKPMYEDEAVKKLLRFLFTYEQTREPANNLSGGERTRLEILLLMLGRANFLVLDEPTNHLDIESLEVLEASLTEYDGTVLFVSHDRYFLDRMADRIFEVRDGTVLSHEGGYSAWRERMSNVVDLSDVRRTR